MDDDEYAIPAAHVQDVDLGGIDPTIAAEIRRLGALMECGDETPQQFAQLIHLLHQEGFSKKSEYLLRRNYEGVEGGLALYAQLFGSEKPDDFAAAIEAFAQQFGVTLQLLEERDFLDRVYRSAPNAARLERLHLLAHPSEVQFDYSEQDSVAADVCSLKDDDYLILHWRRGVWEE